MNESYGRIGVFVCKAWEHLSNTREELAPFFFFSVGDSKAPVDLYCVERVCAILHQGQRPL
jgi:hypothetical protein